MGAPDHRASAQAVGCVGYAVLTVSDSRSEATDTSGRLIQHLLNEAGHRLLDYEVVTNEPWRIQAGVRRFLQGPALCLIVTGGTGVGQRDLTIETVIPLLDKVLPGFGELFRWLSYGEVGSAAMLSRALCGVSRGKVVCCLPGSEAAVRLALSKVLLPELPHLIWVASR
ncbi:MAG: molybdenum cofactor biosynthesis protein MoaB [candidate division NC10 bacterium]|nr:molybdenum cofactor biosynthesis protein MoaB [candidate division NC10 bacterium]MBI4839984.1 molybdenum cofactor biosynthesis protein MoaB [candidate division NC10 bacterium]